MSAAKKPPKDTQFKKGQSGNPKGRPKGSKNLATLLNQKLSSSVLTKDGTRHTYAELIATVVATKAAQGNLKPLREAYQIAAILEPSGPDTAAAPVPHQEGIQAILKSLNLLTQKKI